MIKENLKILKLGGSAITDKAKPCHIKLNVLKRVVKEVSAAKQYPLIIVHGGGSFGHPLAEKYKLNVGFEGEWQVEGFVKTHQAMVSLNKIVVNMLVREGVNATSIQPSAFLLTREGRITFFKGEVLREMLKLKIVPVLYGDVVVDKVKGFTILSGDQLVAKIALTFKAERIVLACDVDGVYTSNPKIDKKAEMFRVLNLKQLKKLVKAWGKESKVKISDVTGGMVGKLLEVVKPVKAGVKVYVVNALKPGRVFDALTKNSVYGTLIVKSSDKLF
ncbi:MAG: isopentenyl phosphate kinase [Candidatus Bathyarchaeota archaeon]|nr:isopentenyl phosphate kinase [Candidatus Bathyarchaeota archaeon]